MTPHLARLRSPRTWRRPPSQLVLQAVLAGLSGGAFLRVLPVDQVVLPVALGAGVATLISGLDAPPGPRTLGRRAAWSAAAFVVFASATALRATSWYGLPRLRSLHALQDALVNGVARLLSSAVPAPSLPSIVLLPLALTWLVAFVGVEVAVRRRAPLAPAVPAAVAFAAVLLLGGRDGLLLPTAALVAGSWVLGVLRSDRAGVGDRRRIGAGVALALGVAVLAAGAAALVPLGSDQFDLHDAAGRPPTRQPEVSPLSRLQGRLLDKADPVMFEVHVPDGEVDRAPNWRLAELDHFDGSQWSTSATALEAGADLPPAPPGSGPDGTGGTLHQQVTLKALDGSWLPTADRASHISLPSVYVSPPSGTLSLLDEVHDGTAYTVVSHVAHRTPAQLQGASIDPAAGTADLAGLPPGSGPAVDAVTSAAAAATKGHGSTPFGSLTALQGYLRAAPFAYRPAAPSGQSYAQVADFLTRTHAGSAEQFAGAFCLMARSQHLPCRVAVGFRRGKAVDGTFTVRSADAFAWPEVPFTGLGWVPFDPTPSGGDGVAPSVADLASLDTSSAGPAPAPVSADVPGGGASGSATPPPGSSSAADLVVWLAVALLTLLLLGPLTVIALKARRRRRLAASPTPALRVLGAWRHASEQLDRPPAGDALTVEEVVTVSAQRFGADIAAPLAELGSITNLALFDRRGPTDQQSAIAWERAHEASLVAASTRTRRARLLRHLDPRPLWRRPAPGVRSRAAR